MNTLRQPPISPSAATAAARPDSGVEVITPDQYSDRRAEPRQARDDTGALLFLSSRQVVTCRILDSSPSGARVAMENLTNIPAEIWLIDLNTQMVKRGTAAWSMANRMGLKFNFIQKMTQGEARPAKVPQEVFDAWLRLTNSPVPQPKSEDSGEDVLYFD